MNLIPALFIAFFMPALYFTDLHPFAVANHTGAINTFITNQRDVEVMVEFIKQHVHEQGGFLKMLHHPLSFLSVSHSFAHPEWIDDPRMEHGLSLCGRYSKFLADTLTYFAFNARIEANPGHVYVVVKPTAGEEIIVDPTARQWTAVFNPAVMQALRYPEIIVAPRSQFHTVLYQLPLKPLFNPLGYTAEYGGVNRQEFAQYVFHERLFWMNLTGRNFQAALMLLGP